VVVVITDGMPLNPARTKKASENLKKKTRLMFVPVGQNVDIESMEQWASKPARENVIHLNHFEALSDPETINAILVDMCPKVSLVK